MATKTKNQKIVTKVEGSQSLAYQGIVSIKTLHGKKVIAEKTYHNSGRAPLFKFICNALGGNFYELERPTKIKLFSFSSNDAAKFTEFNWEKAFGAENPNSPKCIEITPFITYDAAPVIKEVVSNETVTGYKVSYHFRIPYSYISGGNIYVAAIYSNMVASNQNACAFYQLIKEDKTGWDPIIIPSNATDYSIILDWTMSVMNKD